MQEWTLYYGREKPPNNKCKQRDIKQSLQLASCQYYADVTSALTGLSIRVDVTPLTSTVFSSSVLWIRFQTDYTTSLYGLANKDITSQLSHEFCRRLCKSESKGTVTGRCFVLMQMLENMIHEKDNHEKIHLLWASSKHTISTIFTKGW